VAVVGVGGGTVVGAVVGPVVGPVVVVVVDELVSARLAFCTLVYSFSRLVT
jgi:hypothetical protein